MPNELAIVDTQNLSPQTITEINKQVGALIERHKDNRAEIIRIVFEGAAALTAGDKLAQDLSFQGKFKRFRKRFTGANGRTQDLISTNLIAAQYAAQQTLQKLAEQNLMTFELIAAVNNRLNSQMTEVNDEINNIYRILLNFFKQTRADIVQFETRLKNVEQNVNLLNWQNSIEFQMYNGVEYQDLDDAAKIICLVKDFYDITKGTWRTTDLLLLKTAMATIGLNPRDKVSFINFIDNIGSNAELYQKLLGDNAQFATEEEQIVFALRAAEQGKKILSITDAAFPSYEFVLELLSNLRQLEYHKEMHAKLQSGKKLFLRYKLAEALPLLEEASVAGLPEANYMLAVIHDEGVEVERTRGYVKLLASGNSSSENIDALKKSADDGDVFAQYEMAQYHLKAAADYLKRSADQNYFRAFYDLGSMYFVGVGVEKDYVTAKKYLERSGKENIFAILKNRLSAVKPVAESLDNQKRYAEALKLWLLLEAMGNCEAAWNVGFYYRYGNGVAPNYAEAIKHYKRSIELGDNVGWTEYHIAKMYLEGGYGITADRAEARRWYQKAAAKYNRLAEEWLEENPY